MQKILKQIFIILTAIMIVLVILWAIQASRQSKIDNEQRIKEYELAVDRAQADQLYGRLQTLKQLRDVLVVPQVELSIKI